MFVIKKPYGVKIQKELSQAIKAAGYIRRMRVLEKAMPEIVSLVGDNIKKLLNRDAHIETEDSDYIETRKIGRQIKCYDDKGRKVAVDFELTVKIKEFSK